MRDRHGFTQVVIDAADAPEAHAVAARCRPEFVITVEGDVARRLPGMENPRMATGEIELQARDLTILSEARTPPFYINEPDAPVDESVRLQYRYLDIRREPMLRRLLLRSKMVAEIRRVHEEHGFVELVREEKRRGCTERIVRRTAQYLVASPSVLAPGMDPRKLRSGQPFTLRLAEPVKAVGVRVLGEGKTGNSATDVQSAAALGWRSLRPMRRRGTGRRSRRPGRRPPGTGRVSFRQPRCVPSAASGKIDSTCSGFGG